MTVLATITVIVGLIRLEIKQRSIKSSEHISEKGDGQYRGKEIA